MTTGKGASHDRIRTDRAEPGSVVYLLNVAFAASLACGVALAAVAVCGKRSAPLRHGLLLCALVLTLLSPGLMWLRQRTSWGIVRVPVAARQHGGLPVRPESPPPVSPVEPVTGPSTEMVANKSEAEGFRPDGRINRRPNQAGHERESVAASVTDGQAAGRIDAASWPRVLGSMLAGAWAVGVCIGIVMLLRGWVTVIRIRRSCQQPPGTLIQEKAEQEASTVGLAHPPRIYVSRFVPVPLTIGLTRGVIVLPEGIEPDVSEEQLRAVLVHEMAHITRYDHAVGLVQRVVACLFWWNPLVHRVNAHIASLREEICDNHVARAPGGGERFAHLLVDFAARVTGDLSQRVEIGMLKPERKGLDGRIARLLNQERNMTTRLHPKSILVVVGFALSLSGVLLAASAGADGEQGTTTPGGPADSTRVTETKPGPAGMLLRQVSGPLRGRSRPSPDGRYVSF